MEKHCGYYSVIQYCPDRALMEVAGIGVLLFCPELKFVGVRTTQTNRRIEKIFGGSIGDDNFLQSYKESLDHHFKKKFPQGVSFEEMQIYLRSFVNDICFTDIRTTLCVTPEQDLDLLFVRLFGVEDIKYKPKPYRPRKELLRKLHSQKSDILDNAVPRSVKIPEYAHIIEPTMVFMNEVANMVVPKTINPKLKGRGRREQDHPAVGK